MEKPLDRVRNDIPRGDLGKAGDWLHGLIASHPDDLDLRKQLGDLYWRLQMPEMAGRYWYLGEEKDEKMQAACRRLEAQFRGDPALMLFAIRFKGDLEKMNDRAVSRSTTPKNMRSRLRGIPRPAKAG